MSDAISVDSNFASTENLCSVLILVMLLLFLDLKNSWHGNYKLEAAAGGLLACWFFFFFKIGYYQSKNTVSEFIKYTRIHALQMLFYIYVWYVSGTHKSYFFVAIFV